MDNCARGGMAISMIGFRSALSRLVTLMLVCAVFVGSLGLGTMSHAAPQSHDVIAHHQMHDMAAIAHGSHDSAGHTQTMDADYAMAVCCFFQIEEPRADVSGVAMSARFAAMTDHPALPPAPDRAENPPRRT